LAASLGPAWDGNWWLDNVDVAIFTVPILDNPQGQRRGHAGAHRRLRPAHQLPTSRLAGRRCCCSMSSAASPGAGPGHQHRGAGQVVGRRVLLSAQSAAGLGSEPERERLLAASSAVVLFRSPMPAELAALAGSERTHEGAWSFPGGTEVHLTG
jgi:hypothetical protein